LLLVAFAFGGGGSRYGLANLCVQLTAIAILMLQGTPFGPFWRASPLALRILICASLAVPIFQLVPLPEGVWAMLPGRALVESTLGLVGGGGWTPFSLDPLRTMLALSALITPLAVLMCGWPLSRQRLNDLGWGVVALGLFTVLLGVVQLGATTDGTTLYGARVPGDLLLGTFANRNTTGLFLTFALSLAALLPAPRPHPAILPIRLAVCALLALAVILTQSRTAFVLAGIPLLLGSLRAVATMQQSRSQQRGLTGVVIGLGAAALLVVGMGTLLVAAPGRVSETLERFEAKDDPRRFIWDDAAYSAARYWPAGAGMGTFDEIFQIDESLENLTVRRARRAHNDYLELAIEAGLAGLILAALWLVLIGWLSWRVRGSSQRWVAWSGSGFLLAIALQSVTDYPMRNQTILALAGFALLLLARTAADQTRARS
jgi:O-antigen ligase